MVYWLAQGIGVVAFVIGITMFFKRDDRRFKQQLATYSSVIGVHLFLLGAHSAGLSALLSAIRTMVTLRTSNQWVMVIFIALTLVLGLGNARHWMEVLPIIGTVASTWALFRASGLTMRCVMWGSGLGWTMHNIWAGSIGGSLTEGCFLVMNGIAIIRFWRLQRRGIDPFKVETSMSNNVETASKVLR